MTRTTSSTENPAVKKVLILDDVPINLALLRDVLAPHALVVEAATCAQAQMLAVQHAFALMLMDVQLPDGRADTLLARIRADANAASRLSPAMAITGELDADISRTLIQAGFVQTWPKPWNHQALLAAVLPYLRTTVHDVRFDELAALKAAAQNPDLVQKIRAMFLAELPHVVQTLEQDAPQLKDQLHKLSASAGFAGASAIVEALKQYRLQRETQPDAARTELLLHIQRFMQGA